MLLFNNVMASKFATALLMFGICFAFILFLRFLYGPKGIWRKNLWDNTDNDTDNTINEKDNVNR